MRTIVYSAEGGYVFIPLPQDALESLGWKYGDAIQIIGVDGAIVIKKVPDKSETEDSSDS